MVDHELDELKREFLEEARTKIEEMEEALNEAPDPAALDRIAYLAHQLKGSGGSYGYQKISDDAARLEEVVEKAPASTSDVSAKLRGHVLSLAREIDEAARSLQP